MGTPFEREVDAPRPQFLEAALRVPRGLAVPRDRTQADPVVTPADVPRRQERSAADGSVVSRTNEFLKWRKCLYFVVC